MEILTQGTVEPDNQTDQLNGALDDLDSNIPKKRKIQDAKENQLPDETNKSSEHLSQDEESDDGAFCPIVSCLKFRNHGKTYLVFNIRSNIMII